jgi:integrase
MSGAGLPPMRFHDLRHSAATLLLSLGGASAGGPGTAGDATISVTLDGYSHVLPALGREVAARLDAWLGGDATAR